ncbi:hypothetical protein EDB83DRAFT_2523684 [Lactarius deliciosus]|nr:hypothetical protein EDB83DRAFT_2523684 [Lactarius deliciosus]
MAPDTFVREGGTQFNGCDTLARQWNKPTLGVDADAEPTVQREIFRAVHVWWDRIVGEEDKSTSRCRVLGAWKGNSRRRRSFSRRASTPRRRSFPRCASTRFQHPFLIIFVASPVSFARTLHIITMLFELLRSIVRLAWGWVVTVAIGPVGGWMRRRGLRAEFAITLRVKIVFRAEEIVDLVLQPVRLALPRGAAAVQGREIEEV